MDELENQLSKIADVYDEIRDSPFPYGDIRALRQVFEADFDRLEPQDCLSADLNLFCYTIWGWASGGLRSTLPDAAKRYQAKTWLRLPFFDRFPQYRFFQPYDLSEYPTLQREMDLAEHLRTMLLAAIDTYESAEKR